jgi:ubiquinol oxidase
MSDVPKSQPAEASSAPPKLDHDALVATQNETRAAPRRKYSASARALFIGMDVMYGRRRTLSKFKVLELIARVPYQTWEQVAYVAVTHTHRHAELARRIHDRILDVRGQQDNELFHLLILEEQIARSGGRESRLKFFWLPQAIAFGYYHWSWMLYVVRPAWSYRLNADFEDHAEHEYMELVAEHPEWEQEPFESTVCHDYGRFASLADVFRQIGHDERFHKEASVDMIRRARFQ